MSCFLFAPKKLGVYLCQKIIDIMATKHLILLLMATLMLIACNRKDKHQFVHEPKRAVYHWRTTFDPDTAELSFMQRHRVGRIYIHYFDVNLSVDEVVPEATVRFKQTPAEGLEVVPTVYITTDAMREITQQTSMDVENENTPYDYASRIVKRVVAMSTHNHITGVNEIQVDCDWTLSTRQAYFYLLANMRELLHRQGMALSVTVRLHQLCETLLPPADMGVLMLYNTGNLMSEKTHNSILDINDVKPYFKPGTHYGLPLDFAYPVFGWNVCFRGGKFLMLASPQSSVPDGCTVRHEQPSFATIQQVKQLAESVLGADQNHSTIIYHLDQQFLSQYSNEEMEHIFGTR